MEIIIKAVVIAICGAVLTLLLRRTTPEFSLLLALAACAVVLTMALTLYRSVSEVLDLISLNATLSSVFVAPVIKCVGIGITARLGSDLCKDSGQAALASSVEICGAVCAIYVSLPLIKTLLRMIGELV